jgi:tetratricopeptide (TPR) repeat protein
MRKKRRKQSSEYTGGGFDSLPSNSEFYSGTPPTEKPLHEDHGASDHHRIRKTNRHKAVGGRRKEKVDAREKMALQSILKSGVMILLLIIAFFMLRKGISIYEEGLFMDNQAMAGQATQVMREVVLIDEFDIEDEEAREQFAERIELWKRAERFLRSADALIQRGNYDLALERCRDALELDPSHMAALDRVGQIHYQKESYVDAVNAYVRLLSIDPSRLDVQKRLIQALDSYGDFSAVRYMAEWYLDENNYDAEVQRYLANSIYAEESYEEAVVAYERVLQDNSEDMLSLESQAKAYMQIGEYEKALVPLTVLREWNYREQSYYKQIAICKAQLKLGAETVQIYGRAAQLFGENMVMGWMQDPLIDPIRDDRSFQSFAGRIGGEEFRMWLEKMAQATDGADPEVNLGPMLEVPTQPITDPGLLKPRR